jgi:hypothetical protein
MSDAQSMSLYNDALLALHTHEREFSRHWGVFIRPVPPDQAPRMLDQAEQCWQVSIAHRKETGPSCTWVVFGGAFARLSQRNVVHQLACALYALDGYSDDEILEHDWIEHDDEQNALRILSRMRAQAASFRELCGEQWYQRFVELGKQCDEQEVVIV